MAMKADNPGKKSGNKATFIVHVQYRQHATWQGNVVWAETNQTSSFRSALELLKLIDSAMDSEENTDQEPGTAIDPE